MSMADFNPLDLSQADITYTGQCAQKCVCDALDKGLTAITVALTQIDNTIDKYLGKRCQIVDDCKDEIIKLIEDTYNTTAGTCEDCKADLAAGLGGTVEFAVRCAGACIDEIEHRRTTCSLTNEGAPCDTCGQSPCCCTDGTCQPCGEQQQKPTHQYAAWCNQLDNQVFANRDDEPGPDGDGWIGVGMFDDEDAAIAAATQACQSQYVPPIQTQQPPDTQSVPLFCNLSDFFDGVAGGKIIDSANAASILGGSAEAAKAILGLGLEGINIGTVVGLLRGLAPTWFTAPFAVAERMTPRIARLIGCGSDTFIASANVLAAAGAAQKLTGLDLSPFTTRFVYAMNAECPQKFIDPQQAIASYLADGMTGKEAGEIFAVNGYCPQNVHWVAEARKSKLTQQELATLRHRGTLSEEQYGKYMRTLGYTNTEFVSWAFEATYAVPDAQTVYRYLQQGATDQTIVDKLGLNEGYDSLVAGQFADWLAANGVKPEQAQADWQAHWTTPNIGSLFEFLHRLQDNEELGGKEGIESDIQQAMQSLGIPPYWRKFYMAVAYTPLLKRDIRLAYTSGALPDDDLPKALRTTGHDENAVDTLVKELEPARRHAILTHTALRQWTEQMIDGSECKRQLMDDGYTDEVATQAMVDTEHAFTHSSWADAFSKGLIDRTTFISLLAGWGVSGSGCSALADKLAYHIVDHQFVKNYIAGGVTRQNALAGMIADGMVGGIAQSLIKDADDAVINSLYLDCVRGIKHRYLTGEITSDEAYNLVVGRGVDSYRASLLVGNMDCEKAATGRAVPVEKLCHWLYIGAITQADFYDRLIRLGYTEENAALLLYDCVQANTMRAIKEANATAKQLLSDANKRQSAANRAAAARERDAARTAKLRAQKAKLRATREKQLLVASEKVYSLSNADLATALATVRDSVAQIQSRYGMTQDEALRIALVVSDNFKGHEIVDFAVMMDQLAADAVAGVPEPSDADIGVLPSTNGDTQPSEPT